jgi:phosphate transport system ATP-binding protein
MIETAPAAAASVDLRAKLHVSALNFFYGPQQALFDVGLEIPERRVTALIGPSGCGKSTFLRTLNRMYETVRHARAEGRVLLDGEDVLSMDVVALRRRVGMVFQKSNPFPKSIFDNVAYGPRINSRPGKSELKDIVEQSLRRAALWDEVKDKLHESAYALSGGQQQRLCIARALAVNPEVLLWTSLFGADPMPRPRSKICCSAEGKLHHCSVTHNLQQAAGWPNSPGFS